MFFKLKKLVNEDEKNYAKSKVSGSPVFPLHFFNNNNLNDDLFVAQINLSEINHPLLPQDGFLYFFLDVEMYPYKAKVFYTKENVREVYELINEGFEYYGDTSGYEICLTDEEVGSMIFIDRDENLELESHIDTENMFTLLEFDSLELPINVLNLGNPDGWYLFVIKKEDLKKLDFSKVEFVMYGS